MRSSCKNSRYQWGQQTEHRACQWFLTQYPGCRLLAQNYRCRGGEIDLIFETWVASEKQWELVFVEVRARACRGWVNGIQSLTLKKQACLKRAIAFFLAQYKGSARTLRVSLLAWDGFSWTYFPDLWSMGG